MEILVFILMMLIVLNCSMKTSLWTFWPRLAFALLLGAFAYWSIDYAVMQSKTQIDNWLHREDVLQGIAIIVTLESAIGMMFCFSSLNDDGKRPRRRFIRLLLHAYPSLLIFPVVFYGLTKLLFLHVGMDFTTTSLIYAIAVIAVSLLCATLARWLLPPKDLRIEAHLWLTVIVCVLSLLLTQNGEFIYRSNVKAVDWTSAVLTLAAAAIVMAVGFIGSKLKWKSKNNKK
jgi:uncharacterized membrane protein